MTAMTRSSRPEEAGGHYVTSGLAVAGLGAFGLAAAVALKAGDFEFGFIDLRAMGVTCVLFLVVGLSMVASGRKSDD